MQESLRTKGFMLVTSDGKLMKATDLILPSPYNPYPVQEIFGATMQYVFVGSVVYCRGWRSFFLPFEFPHGVWFACMASIPQITASDVSGRMRILFAEIFRPASQDACHLMLSHQMAWARRLPRMVCPTSAPPHFRFVTTAYVPAPPLVHKPPSEEVWASWRRFLMRLGANLLFQIVRTPTGYATVPHGVKSHRGRTM